MIVAIIQARMGSTRLPGKVLTDIGGRPLIDHVVARVRLTPGIDEIVVASTENTEDDRLVEHLQKQGVAVFRGSENDVLDRYYRCAVKHKADIIVRVTADDPWKDPSLIARAIAALQADPALDYCSNTLTPTYPDGLDIEAVRMSALARAHAEATLPSEREHVMPYIWNHPERFKLLNFTHSEDLSSWRLTVDHAADLELARRIYAHFGSDRFDLDSLITLLKTHPELRAINSGPQRNEGYLKSLKEES